MKRFLKNLSTLNLLILIHVCVYANASASTDSEFEGSVELIPNKAYSRLTLTLDSSFKPIFTDSANGFTLKIPGATLMDLGVPVGSEGSFNQFLSTISDARISSLRVSDDSTQLILVGKYKFPTGPGRLANPEMDHFDFRKNELGKFCLDFFYKKGTTQLEAERNKKTLGVRKLQEEKEEMQKKEAERKALREKRILESKNALLFCEFPFDRTNTIFIKYRVDHPVVKFNSYFPEKIPDHLFEYNEPKGNTEEAQMVRFALKLARENKEALSIKTIEFLEKQYPKSRFQNEMLFLKANDLYRLGFEEKGRSLLQSIAKRARGTEFALQASAFLAVQSFKNKEWLAALEGFMNLKREMPKSKLAWLFRFGMAESFFQIKQTEQAKQEYEWVAKYGPTPEIRAEAAFKAGDVYLDRNQYAQAVLVYEDALKKHASEAGHYPEVLMNLAESYFQLGEFVRSEGVFQKYLDLGGNHTNAWRASLRIAEIKSLHQKISPEIEAAFTETINRYPMSPGALIARLRLLPCGSHGGFDLASFQRLIHSPEVKNFDGDGAMYTEPFQELVAVTEVRTLLSFGQDETAIKQGILRLRENPTPESRRFIEQSMIGGIKRMLGAELDGGDEISAIATFQKYGDYLPLPLHDPMADDLKMKLARAASKRNLTTLALKIIEPYQKLGGTEAKEVIASVEKNLLVEGVDEQEDRNFIEAKTRWNAGEFKTKDDKGAQELLGLLNRIRDQSKFAFDRDLILALFYSEIKNFEAANGLAVKIQSRLNHLNIKEKIQVLAFLGETASLAHDDAGAEKAFHQARLLLEKKPDAEENELILRHLSSGPSLSYLVQSEGESLQKEDKWKEAIALYTKAIENKVGGNHILYSHAKALLKMGGRDSKSIASRSLEKIQQSQDDDVWKRLAHEALDEIAKEGKVDEKRNP